MDDLRERLARFQDDGEKIIEALEDQDWPTGGGRKAVEMLIGDLGEVVLDLNHLIILDEAWE